MGDEAPELDRDLTPRELSSLVGKLETAVTTLTGAVQELSRNATRGRLGNAFIGALVIAVATLVSLYYFVELPNRRADYFERNRRQVCDVVNGRPAHSAALRLEYNCPALPAARGSASPSASRTAAARPRSTRTPSSRPSLAPSPTITQRTRSAAAPRPTATRTAYRTAAAPAPRTSTVTRSAAPAPAPTRTVVATETRGPCILGLLFCT